MLSICRKATSGDENYLPTIQNRFAHAKFALRRILEVSRRDGLSSWRIILYGPVGMSSCSWGETNIYFSMRNVELSMSCFYLNSLVICSYAPQMTQFGACNTSAPSVGSGKQIFEKLRRRTEIDFQKCTIDLHTQN